MTMDRSSRAKDLFLLALACQEKGDLDGAERLYRQALELTPGRVSVLNNLAAVLLQSRRYGEAEALCEQALKAAPGDPIAILNSGNCKLRLGRPEDALARYERALAIRPGYADALVGRAAALLDLERPLEALAASETVLAGEPGHVGGLINLGVGLRKLDRRAEALASYDKALAIRPRHGDALLARANVLLELHRYVGAAADLKHLLEVDPARDDCLCDLVYAKTLCGDWSDHDAEVGRLISLVRAGKRVASPLPFLALVDSAGDQLTCARTHAKTRHPPSPVPMWNGEKYGHGRIRVAYLSPDFREHAVSRLAAGLFEKHDRTRFEVIALSLGPDEPGEVRERVVRAFDRFVDVRGIGDREAATLVRSLEVDIVVDLAGFTTHARPGILALRPAPVQVSYLGYPGTLGTGYHDYILADAFVVPDAKRAFYSENVVYLPEGFQVNDSTRPQAAAAPPRSESGLPESGFVFCSFNNTYKINPAVFDIWMRLLRRVDGSVLWLLARSPAVPENLRSEASRRGVSPERLVFAPHVDYAEYLGRYRTADLFLDTFPFNAGTTASDALWAGLPVLTRSGESFAARMAGSLLKTLGLPELITGSAEDYQERAATLAADRGMLADVRRRLERARAASPLFDTGRFCRHLEAAYVTMWQRARDGLPPAGFSVDRLAAGGPT
jgi:protein O-GlcNAc transferase